MFSNQSRIKQEMHQILGEISQENSLVQQVKVLENELQNSISIENKERQLRVRPPPRLNKEKGLY